MNVIDPAAVAAVRGRQVPGALPGRRESLVCKVLRDSREKQALRVRRDREERWGRREKQAPRARRDREERWGRREK